MCADTGVPKIREARKPEQTVGEQKRQYEAGCKSCCRFLKIFFHENCSFQINKICISMLRHKITSKVQNSPYQKPAIFGQAREGFLHHSVESRNRRKSNRCLEWMCVVNTEKRMKKTKLAGFCYGNSEAACYNVEDSFAIRNGVRQPGIDCQGVEKSLLCCMRRMALFFVVFWFQHTEIGH